MTYRQGNVPCVNEIKRVIRPTEIRRDIIDLEINVGQWVSGGDGN